MHKEDFNWFVENYMTLFSEYGHKFIAIKDKTILGAFDDIVTAIKEISTKHELGSFIVQECNGDESAYTNYISSWELV